MHIHILGICGTFMAGIALIAKEMGHEVSGSDENVYPPMSEVLQTHSIKVHEGYHAAHLTDVPDLVLVGNVISRGNPMIEHVLAYKIPFASGPEWLAREVLKDRWVLAIAGTHGKTTTTSLLAWIMEFTQHKPGFLIGGQALNFDVPARLGEAPFFIIEADEYDTAFFDKRPKFVHYHPLSLGINNLEYDHADIFPDIDAIKQQFHYLLRTVPPTGRVVADAASEHLTDVLQMGCWSDVVGCNLSRSSKPHQKQWRARLLSSDGSHFAFAPPGGDFCEVKWELVGSFNVSNALLACACAHHAGISPEDCARALEEFRGVRRRLDLLADIDGIKVYEDFAHHPTAIASTLEAMSANVAKHRVIAVLELASNTMRGGTHRESLKAATSAADRVLWYGPPSLEWDLEATVSAANTSCYNSTDAILPALQKMLKSGDHVVFMSNGSFDGLPNRLVAALKE